MKFCPQCGLRLDASDDEAGTKDPLVGQHFDGHYEVLSRVAVGGFGTIYRVRDLELNTIVALKVLHPHRASGPNQIRRFRLDAQLLRQLGRHTNHLPELHHFAQDRERGLWYFTLEFLEGETLHQLLQRETPLAPDRGVAILRQVCSALTAAHSQDPPVVHRDLKPDNIFIVDRGGRDFVKVLDFGIAKRLGHDSLTDVGHVVGSAGYMSPEQYRGEDVDGRTDLFALGVIFYNMVTGKEPWLGLDFDSEKSRATQLRMLDAMLNKTQGHDGEPAEAPIPISEAGVDVSAATEEVVLRLLKTDPAERFQSASELDRALERLQLTVGVPSGGSLRVESVPSGAAVILKREAATIGKGVTPWEIGPLPSGDYVVRVRAKRCEPAQASVRIVEDQVSQVKVPLERTASTAERALEALGRTGASLRRATRRLVEITPWKWVAAGGAVAAAALAIAANWGTLLAILTGPPEVSAGSILSQASAGQVSELVVRADGTLEAHRGAEHGNDVVEVALGSMGLRDFFRDARGGAIPIRHEREPASVSFAIDTPGGGAPGGARIVLRGASPGCSPCQQSERLDSGWYELRNESDDWLIQDVRVRYDVDGEEEWTPTLPDSVYLSGAFPVAVRVTLVHRADLELETLLEDARDAVGSMDYQVAVGHLSQALELEPENDDVLALFATIGDGLAVQAGLDLPGRPERALDAANACIRLLPTAEEACVAVRDSANAIIRNRPGPIVVPPPPVPPPPGPPPPGPPPPPPPEEQLAAALAGEWTGFIESWSGGNCNAVPVGPGLGLTAQGATLTGRVRLLVTCGATPQGEIDLILDGRVTGEALTLVGERDGHACTYSAPVDAISGAGIQRATFECPSAGIANGLWRLLGKSGP
ncbi:MAG: serine/threonine-protein kinase [Gemmatimonadota bacterium]|nr:serine/threonine-protein kinase [Gemmatimonadota bacterium]